MKHHTKDRAQPLAVKAKTDGIHESIGKSAENKASANLTSLGNAIRTKEQADNFMRKLRSL
ncbi:MAG: hypothetical protein JWP94_511 [Mucilaginibacter sp.]|nr:hypothetical protein [Mucilaginibacter sp.]